MDAALPAPTGCLASVLSNAVAPRALLLGTSNILAVDHAGYYYYYYGSTSAESCASTLPVVADDRELPLRVPVTSKGAGAPRGEGHSGGGPSGCYRIGGEGRVPAGGALSGNCATLVVSEGMTPATSGC